MLHVITRLILGGAQENTLFTVIGQQKDPRFEVTLLAGSTTGAEGDLHGEARAAGVDLVLLPPLVRDDPAVAGRARPGRPRTASCARGRFHIVHTHSSKAGILGRAAARIAGVPIVVHTLHSLVFHEYQSALENRVVRGAEAPGARRSPTRFISVNGRTGEGRARRRASAVPSST